MGLKIMGKRNKGPISLNMMENRARSRRFMLKTGLALPALYSLCHPARKLFAQSATPGCKSAKPTRKQTEGPFFTPDTPEKSDFRGDAPKGEPLILEAVVRDKNCQIIPGTQVELWHAGPDGAYDNKGYKFRGHQYADARGRVTFKTLVPGLYPGRTRHFHIKVQPPGGRMLTTQLYFPGETGNILDWGHKRELEMDISPSETGLSARFDFIIA